MSDEKVAKFFRKNKIATAGICILLILFTAVGGFAGFKIAKLLAPAQPVVTTDQIREEVEPVLMAVSYKYNFTEILHHSDTMGLKIPFVEELLKNNYVATIEGTALIGVDMGADAAAIEYGIETNPDGSLRKVEVVLPKSEIFAIDFNEESLTVYEDRGSMIPLVNKISKEDYQVLREEAEKQQEQQVVDNGLLDSSDERIREIVTAQIKAIHGENVFVEVSFVERDAA